MDYWEANKKLTRRGCAPSRELCRLPRSEDHGAARHAARFRQRHQGPQVPRGGEGLRRRTATPRGRRCAPIVCAQCHVEYYCGTGVTLFFPWDKGLKAEEIEAHYDSVSSSRGSASSTGSTPRREPRCSRPNTPSSRCGARASTRAAVSPARTVTCLTRGTGP